MSGVELMETKLSKLVQAMHEGRYDDALSIAAKFPQLGDHRARIVRGHEANKHARFYKSMGKDIESLRQDGIQAIRERYADHL